MSDARYTVRTVVVPGGVQVAVYSNATGLCLWDAGLAYPLTPRGRLEIAYAASHHIPNASTKWLEGAITRAAKSHGSRSAA